MQTRVPSLVSGNGICDVGLCQKHWTQKECISSKMWIELVDSGGVFDKLFGDHYNHSSLQRLTIVALGSTARIRAKSPLQDLNHSPLQTNKQAQRTY